MWRWPESVRTPVVCWKVIAVGLVRGCTIRRSLVSPQRRAEIRTGGREKGPDRTSVDQRPGEEWSGPGMAGRGLGSREGSPFFLVLVGLLDEVVLYYSWSPAADLLLLLLLLLKEARSVQGP